MYDFSLTPEQEEIQSSFRDFCEKKIAPHAERLDREAAFCTDQIKTLGEYGYLGMSLPKEYGGSGLPYLTFILAGEELARVCAATYLSSGASVGLAGTPILSFGTDDQKTKYVPDLISAEKIGAMAITEPHCGSDVRSIKTRAERKGDSYLLNGSKMFITNGPIADVVVVYAKTDPNAGY